MSYYENVRVRFAGKRFIIRTDNGSPYGVCHANGEVCSDRLEQVILEVPQIKKHLDELREKRLDDLDYLAQKYGYDD